MNETPAATIRRAAALMRERAEAIPADEWGALPWAAVECEHGCPCVVYHGEYKPFDEPQVPPIQYVCDAETPEHAAHITSWHPITVDAVADLLEAIALTAVPPWESPVTRAALKTARAYLGEGGSR